MVRVVSEDLQIALVGGARCHHQIEREAVMDNARLTPPQIYDPKSCTSTRCDCLRLLLQVYAPTIFGWGDCPSMQPKW